VGRDGVRTLLVGLKRAVKWQQMGVVGWIEVGSGELRWVRLDGGEYGCMEVGTDVWGWVRMMGGEYG